MGVLERRMPGRTQRLIQSMELSSLQLGRALCNAAKERGVNAELFCYTSVQTIEPPMPAETTTLDGRWFCKHGIIQEPLCLFFTLPDSCKPLCVFEHHNSAFRNRAMLNIEAFRELCRKASIEKDPAKLEILKDALRIMLRFEGVAVEPAGKQLHLKPN